MQDKRVVGNGNIIIIIEGHEAEQVVVVVMGEEEDEKENCVELFPCILFAAAAAVIKACEG